MVATLKIFRTYKNIIKINTLTSGAFTALARPAIFWSSILEKEMRLNILTDFAFISLVHRDD